VTQELGRRLEKLVASRVLGQMPDPDLSRWLETIPAQLRTRLAKFDLLDTRSVAGGKPLTAHLADFRKSLLAKEITAKQANEVTSKVQRILQDCRFRLISEISASRVERYLAGLRDNGDGISAQTSNSYLKAIKQFCRWLVRDRRTTESPVAHLSGVNVKLDRRHDRRNLTAQQLVALLEATMMGETHHKLDGRSRAMLYRLAMETGLRRKELATLTPASFDFDADEPTVYVAPGDVKNRKSTTLPIRPVLADELQQWFANRNLGGESHLWSKLTAKTAEMLRRDLEVVGIPYVDDAGLYADFHSLRHSFLSLIAQGGVHPKLAQRLARHSDINLTMSRYTHTLLSEEAEALDVLPEFPSAFRSSEEETHALQATGTDGTADSQKAEQTTPNERLTVCLPENPANDRNTVQCGAVSNDSGSIDDAEAFASNKRSKPRQNRAFAGETARQNKARSKYTRRDSNPQPSVPKVLDS
jgi:integrase